MRSKIKKGASCRKGLGTVKRPGRMREKSTKRSMNRTTRSKINKGNKRIGDQRKG